MKTKSKQNANFLLLNVFRWNTKGDMKTIRQYEIAEWLGVKPATLANIFCENRRPSRLEAKRLEAISGVSFEDWLLSSGSALRQKVFTAWAVRRGESK